MEGGSSSFSSGGRKVSELERLQKQHDEKMLIIQELKRQKDEAKVRLEKAKEQVSEEKMEGFKHLNETYNGLRDEYNAMLPQKYKD